MARNNDKKGKKLLKKLKNLKKLKKLKKLEKLEKLEKLNQLAYCRCFLTGFDQNPNVHKFLNGYTSVYVQTNGYVGGDTFSILGHVRGDVHGDVTGTVTGNVGDVKGLINGVNWKLLYQEGWVDASTYYSDLIELLLDELYELKKGNN